MNRLYRFFLAWLDRRFPTHTHCADCGEKLPQPSHFGLCQKCNASY